MYDQGTTEDFSARTAAALASIERDRLRRQGEQATPMFAALAFGEALNTTPLGKMAKAAQAVCIIAAGVIPVALFWSMVWPG